MYVDQILIHDIKQIYILELDCMKAHVKILMDYYCNKSELYMNSNLYYVELFRA